MWKGMPCFHFDISVASSYRMYHQVEQLHSVLFCSCWEFCTVWIPERDYFSMRRSPFYNWDGMCLLCSTNWILTYNSLTTEARFNTRLVRVRFVVHKGAPIQGFLRVLWFYTFHVFPPILQSSSSPPESTAATWNGGRRGKCPFQYFFYLRIEFFWLLCLEEVNKLGWEWVKRVSVY